MATAVGRVDEFVKDYLIYRGFSSSLKTLELEIKNEKERGFRVDKIVEQLQSYVSTHDLGSLRDYWNFLNSRLFARLEQRYMTSVRKLEVGLLKYYLVVAAQNNKQDKIIEFFERMTEILQTQTEFKEWFAFPFVRNPKDNTNFATYFTSQWQDTFFLSLHNFLSVILQAMPGPVLLNFEAEHREIKELQAENERLKLQLLSLGEKPDPEFRSPHTDSYLTDRSHMDLVYDFSSLGGDTAIPETSTKSPKKFPFPSSPLHIGKKTEKTSSSVKGKDDQYKMTPMGSKNSKSSKSSNLLPVITRQKRSAQKLGRTSSTDSTGGGVQIENTTNQNTTDLNLANQKLKKLEEAKLKRKELFEGGSDKTKSAEKKTADSKTDIRGDYSRSVSEPGTQQSPSRSPRGTRRTVSKSLLETKASYSFSPKTADLSTSGNSTITMDTVSPLATASVATMLGTGLSGQAEELQTFPPAISQTEDTPSKESDQKHLETIHEKPFLLLSQDQYTEHRSAVSYARFSNSGQYVASVDIDGVVKVWTWSPKANTAATVMSKSAFLSLEWASKSDRWLLLGNHSGNIRLFDVKEMKSFYEASADLSYPRIVNICSNPVSPTFVCSATSGASRSGSIGSDTGPNRIGRIGKLSVWDLKTMKTEKFLPLEPNPVCINTSAFNHNGQLLVTGGVDGIIRLFDVSQQRCISQWSAHVGEIRSIVYSADYNSCYSLGNDGKLIEWSMHKTGRKIRGMPIHDGIVPAEMLDPVPSLKESPMGKLLALDSDGQYMLSCNHASAEIYKLIKDDPGLIHMMDLKCHNSSVVTTVDWSPNIDTKICLTGYLDGKIVVSTLLSQ